MHDDSLPDPAPPRVTHSAFSTRDPELAWDVLRTAYAENQLVVNGTRGDFTFGHWTVEARGFAINRLSIGADITFVAETTRDEPYLVLAPLSGRLAYFETAYSDAYADVDAPVLVPPRSTMRTVCEQVDDVLVPLDPAEVAAYAAATTGIEPDELTFHDINPISPALGRHWNATVAHVRETLLDPWASTQPLVLEQGFRNLAAALLSTFPNTALDAANDPLAPRPGRVGDTAVRAVLDHLHDRDLGPADLSDLTALAGAPVRDLDEALRRRRNTTLAEQFWAARMHGAHRDLQEGSTAAGDTVAAIAARWGFTNPATFTVAYSLSTGGETPEDTLRR